jgi:hypothetical protein
MASVTSLDARDISARIHLVPPCRRAEVVAHRSRYLVSLAHALCQSAYPFGLDAGSTPGAFRMHGIAWRCIRRWRDVPSSGVGVRACVRAARVRLRRPRDLLANFPHRRSPQRLDHLRLWRRPHTTLSFCRLRRRRRIHKSILLPVRASAAESDFIVAARLRCRPTDAAKCPATDAPRSVGGRYTVLGDGRGDSWPV